MNDLLGIFFQDVSSAVGPITTTGGNAMQVMTCNIRNTPDLPRSSVVTAAKIVSGKASIIGFQEITEEEDKLDVMTGLGSAYAITGRHTTTPIAYMPSVWKVDEPYEVLAVKGQAHVSSNRHVVAARFKSVKTGMPPFVVMNVHMVVGAYNHGALGRPDLYQTRVEKWNHQHAVMAAKIAEYNLRGYNVIFTGDFNRRHMPAKMWGVNAKWLDNNPNSLDHIGVAFGKNSALKMDGMQTMVTKNPSDHKAVTVSINAKW